MAQLSALMRDGRTFYNRGLTVPVCISSPDDCGRTDSSLTLLVCPHTFISGPPTEPDMHWNFKLECVLLFTD